MYCVRPDDPNVVPLAVEYPLVDEQVPVHADPVQLRAPEKPELQVHNGAPAAFAGHDATAQPPVQAVPDQAMVLVKPVLHTHDGAPTAFVGHAASEQEPVHVWETVLNASELV